MKHLVKWLLAHIVHFIFLSLYVNIYSVFIVCVDICVSMYILCVVCISVCMCMLYVYTQAHLYGIHKSTLGDFLNLCLYYDLRHDLSQNMKALIWIDWQASYPCGSSCFLCSGGIIAGDFFIICFFLRISFLALPFSTSPNSTLSITHVLLPSPLLLPLLSFTLYPHTLPLYSGDTVYFPFPVGSVCVSLRGLFVSWLLVGCGLKVDYPLLYI